jgi:hypothetical protein
MRAEPAAPETGTGVPGMNSDGDNDLSESAGEMDLYGNDVTAAVAEYKFDGTGTLYEMHSPQTEVPRLPSPKS